MELIVNVPSAEIRRSPKEQAARPDLSCVEDEVLFGMRLYAEGEEKEGWIPVMTEYRYKGWVRRGDCAFYSREKETEASSCVLDLAEALSDYPDNNRVKIILSKSFADVLSGPSVKASAVIRSLPRGARVEIADDPSGAEHPSWQKVKLPDGREGYIPEGILGDYYARALINPDGSLTEDGRRSAWLSQGENPEEIFRRRITSTARLYKGACYRWGCKTPSGIDCSGLCHTAYILNGIRIFRDSHMEDDFPIHPITMDKMKEGDLIYFPGHVAMYLGNQEYIHSTAAAGSDGVTINSLDPASPIYRADLPEEIRAVGSYFTD